MATHFGFFTVIPGTDTPISLTPGGDIDRDLDFHLPPDTTGDPGVQAAGPARCALAGHGWDLRTPLHPATNISPTPSTPKTLAALGDAPAGLGGDVGGQIGDLLTTSPTEGLAMKGVRLDASSELWSAKRSPL